LRFDENENWDIFVDESKTLKNVTKMVPSYSMQSVNSNVKYI